jgi:nucleotidyltransferase/DNA polymerase involved in DNA repair
MKRSAAEILREYGPFPGVDHVHGVTFDGQHVWFAAGDKLNAFDPASGKVLRSIDVAAQERPSTASTCFRSPRIASRRSIRRPAVCSRRSRRLAAAVTRGSRGPKGRSGWGSIGAGRSIKSIPKRGRFFAPSSPTASSPPELVFVPPRFDVYRTVSRQIYTIFADYTALIEPLSLDEAYLDVTENQRGLPTASTTAKEIRARIFEETRLTASAGVSYNKFLAKLASGQRKPNEQIEFVIEANLDLVDWGAARRTERWAFSREQSSTA